jgi:hypothetical protein
MYPLCVGMAFAYAVSRATAMTGPAASPAIVEAAARLKAQSFLIDGEAVIAREDRTPGAARWSKGQYHSNASGSRVT